MSNLKNVQYVEEAPLLTAQSSFNNRLRYYRRLGNQTHETRDFFEPPKHLIPELVVIPLIQPEKGGKQSSITTIFSIWNTMMGSSLLALPWAFTQSGFAMGLANVIVIGMICLYTAILIVKTSVGEEDFIDTCRKYCGKPGQYIGWVSSILVLIGAIMAFHILMSDGLYSLVLGISENKIGSWWSTKIAAAIIFAVVFPLANIKRFEILVKINSGGVFCVIYIIAFIILKSIIGRTDDFVRNVDIVKQYDGTFYYLSGILSLSFFVHNCVLPILANQAHPEHNVRDLSFGYLLVGLSLGVVGGFAYWSYSSTAILEDFLNMFADDDIYAMTTRVALILQLVSVMPVILFIIRIQIYGFIYSNPYPSFAHVFGLNLTLMTITTLVAVFYPKVGTVLRFTGAGCGLIYIFLLPISVHLLKLKSEQNLTISSVVFHGFLILIGVAIFIAQFF